VNGCDKGRGRRTKKSRTPDPRVDLRTEWDQRNQRPLLKRGQKARTHQRRKAGQGNVTARRARRGRRVKATEHNDKRGRTPIRETGGTEKARHQKTTRRQGVGGGGGGGGEN